MKRIALVTLVVLSLSYIGACASSHETPPPPPPPSGPSWTNVNCPSGVTCWRTAYLSSTQPEIVFLQMSNTEYTNNFVGKELNYLYNSAYQIISQKPNLVLPRHLACDPASNPCGPITVGDWTIIVSHTPNSTVLYDAIQHP